MLLVLSLSSWLLWSSSSLVSCMHSVCSCPFVVPRAPGICGNSFIQHGDICHFHWMKLSCPSQKPQFHVILHQGCPLILCDQSLHNSNHLHVQILRPWLSICKSAFLFLGEQWDDDKISPLCQHPRVDCHTSYFRVILIPKLCCLVGARSMMAGWLLAASSSMWLGSQSAVVHASSVLVFWHTGLHFQTSWWLALRAAPKVLAVGTASCRQPLATRQLLEKYFVHYESLLAK